MYELTVERTFCAAHAISIAGTREPVHGHNWRVTAVVAGEELDADGLLCDFHLIVKMLDAILQPFHNADLNDTPPFDRDNPTAERIAGFIAQQLQSRLTDFTGETVIPPGVHVSRVTVTEAPGCSATYRSA